MTINDILDLLEGNGLVITDENLIAMVLQQNGLSLESGIESDDTAEEW